MIKEKEELNINDLYNLIKDRALKKPKGSYTCKLLDLGLDYICKKISEEATEVVIAAKNRKKGEIIYESADLTYHILILLYYFGLEPKDIKKELEKRLNK